MIGEGERQYGTSLAQIKANHVQRYQWAIDSGAKGLRSVIDAGCGIGYGSMMLAKENKVVYGLEANEDASKLADHYYRRGLPVKFIRTDLHSGIWPTWFMTDRADAVVCFECLEHLIHPELALYHMHLACKPNAHGYFSVPNLNVAPARLEGNPFHLRHYTPHEFRNLLESCGWSVSAIYDQNGGPHNPDPVTLTRGDGGRNLLAHAVRVEAMTFGGVDPEMLMEGYVARAQKALIERCRAIKALREK